MKRQHPPKPIRLLWILLGHISVGLAVIGAILPLFPTTPFLLLAAACYSRGSEKFYTWLFANPWFGQYLKNYREGKGIPSHVKILVIGFMWISTLVSVFLIVPWTWLKLLLMIVPAILTIHILTIGRGRNARKGGSP